QIDPVTRAITVRALLPNEHFELKQGMLMTLELYADERQAIVVPEAALVPVGSNNFVFVLREENGTTWVDRVQIQIGERLQGAVEVLSGLESGQKVVTHGLQKIRNGQKVRVAAEAKAGDSLAELLKRNKS